VKKLPAVYLLKQGDISFCRYLGLAEAIFFSDNGDNDKEVNNYG